MIRASRPLRFIVIVVGGWIAMRVVVLWPVEGQPDRPAPARDTPSPARPETDRHPGLDPASRASGGVACRSGCRVEPGMTGEHNGGRKPSHADARTSVAKQPEKRFAVTSDTPASIGPPRHTESPLLVASAPPPKSVASHRPSSRWGGSAWLIARGGGSVAVPFAPQLGGSQAGARVTYALGEARRIAIAARVSTALAMSQSEAAIGLDWRPTRHPVHLFAEQRIAIANARGGPTIGVIAGLPPTRLAAGFALEGYGQAGVIARGGGEGFVDAAVRAMRPVASVGNARV